MKVQNVKILLLTIACVGLSAGLLHAAKPSLSAAKNAQTIGALLAVIRAASDGRLGDFFEFDEQNQIAKPKIFDEKEKKQNVGTLQTDPSQIEKIKANLRAQPFFKRAKKPEQKKLLDTADKYKNYLLYFTYGGKKIYIEDPWPHATPTKIHNLIQKWNT